MDLRAEILSDVLILDIGSNNLRGICTAMDSLQITYTVSDGMSGLDGFSRICLPGSGSSGYMAKELIRTGLAYDLLSKIDQGVLLLGICAGMQLLLDTTTEGVDTPANGLGAVSGEVTALEGGRLNVGWCSDDLWGRVYFLHGFCCRVTDDQLDSVSYIKSDVQNARILASFRKNNVMGCQFHPEKSAVCGARVLTRFLDGSWGERDD